MSRIEGTQATVDEVPEHEAGLLNEGTKFQDSQEISNDQAALYAAREQLKETHIADSTAAVSLRPTPPHRSSSLPGNRAAPASKVSKRLRPRCAARAVSRQSAKSASGCCAQT